MNTRRSLLGLVAAGLLSSALRLNLLELPKVGVMLEPSKWQATLTTYGYDQYGARTVDTVPLTVGHMDDILMSIGLIEAMSGKVPS